MKILTGITALIILSNILSKVTTNTISNAGVMGVLPLQALPPAVPTVPCPKNYMFTCQPNMAPVPCSQTSASALNQAPLGSYSEAIPTIITVPYAHPYNYQSPIINQYEQGSSTSI